MTPRFRFHITPEKAIAVGDPSYRTIKGILIAGTETDPVPDAGDAGAAAFLHGPAGLFAAAGAPSDDDPSAPDRDDAEPTEQADAR